MSKNNRKTTVAYRFLFKNDRFSFSKSSKRVGHFFLNGCFFRKRNDCF